MRASIYNLQNNIVKYNGYADGHRVAFSLPDFNGV
jgi:hypothetical protein